MKANQAFLYEEEDAVSPVIGVILMVAITVVLAAVVFVLVQDLGQGTGTTAPNVGFTKSESDDQIKVSSTETGTQWSDYQIRANRTISAGLNVAESTTPTTASDDVNATLTSLTSTDNIQASDYLEFCGGSALTNVKLTLVHEESGSVAAEFEFSSIAACAS